jgi:hypothetical protein
MHHQIALDETSQITFVQHQIAPDETSQNTSFNIGKHNRNFAKHVAARSEAQP